MTKGGSVVFAAAALVGAVGLACADPTQIVVKVSTDQPCSAFGKVEVRVAKTAADLDTAVAQVTESTSCTNGDLGSLVVIPDKDDTAKVFVRALLSKAATDCTPPGANCIVATRTATFIPGKSVDLPVLLAATCKGVACTPGQTCVTGACASF